MTLVWRVTLCDKLTIIAIKVRNAAAHLQGKEHAALGEAQPEAVDGHSLHIVGLVLEATLALLRVEAAARKRESEM